MQECIITVFDTATAYHEKNKVWIEGWKTNKSYRVNKRIIIPWGVSYDQRWGFSVKFGRCQDFLSDLDKVLSWLSGINLDSDTFQCSYQTLDYFCDRTRQGADYQSTVESTFFKIKIFKKGTLHLDFKDLTLLATFNQAAAIGKKWMGGGY